MKQKVRTRMLCEGAIMIALALVLGLFPLYEFPQGGSISLEMLPLLLFCVRWGIRDGLVGCLAFSILQVFVQGAVSWGWVSILLDYVVAFTVLCLAGLGRGSKYGIFWGSVLGCAARFLVHFVSGVTVYRIVAPTEVLGTVFDNPVLYSVVYNGSYMAVDLALCLVLFAILYKPLNKYFVVPKQRPQV